MLPNFITFQKKISLNSFGYFVIYLFAKFKPIRRQSANF